MTGGQLLLGTARALDRRHCLSILIFHRVLPAEDPFYWGDPPAARFAALMACLRDNFTVLPLREALERLEARSLPRRAAAITFDDGYADNLDVAAPVLRSLDLPATVFVASGYCNGGWMWNDRIIEAFRRSPLASVDARAPVMARFELRDEAARVRAAHAVIDAVRHIGWEERDAFVRALQEDLAVDLPPGPMMDHAQVRAIRAAGWDVGAHTVTHRMLTRLADDEAKREIGQSRADLEDVLREPVPLFAYPNGKPGSDYGPAHVRMVQQAGFAGALSTIRGAARGGGDRYQVPRFTPWDREPARFCLRLSASRLGAAR
jgi:peptidoglycan/xylan/chitin deacetylase (PgdA/CDA1 family)